MADDSVKDSVRWAVVGTGTVCRMIAPDFALESDSVAAAVVSRSHSAADEFGDRFSIPRRYDSYERMLDDDAVDAVYLGTPLGTHFELALRALRAGKHVLVEKALVPTVGSAEELFAAADERGLFIMEAMWANFSPLRRRLLTVLDAGTIGDVRSVRASFGLPFPHDDHSRWRGDLLGGVIFDQAIYAVTLARAVLGEPRRMSVAGTVREDGVDLSAHFTLDHDISSFAQISVSMVDFIEPSATIGGTEGWVDLPAPFWSTDSMTVHSGGFPGALTQRQELTVELEGNGYVPMIRACAEAIRCGWSEHPLHPRDETLGVLDTLRRVRDELAAAAV